MIDKKHLFIFGATISLILWATLWLWQKLVVAVGQAAYLPPQAPAVNNLWLLIIFALLAAYVASYYVVGRQVKLTIGVATLSALILLLIPPFLSADLYLYIIYPKMVLSGFNPFILPLDSMSGDIFFNSGYVIQAWRPYAMAYGPAWLVLAWPFVASLANSVVVAVLSLKIMAVTFFALTGYLIYLIGKKLSPAQIEKKLFLYLLSPFILLEVVIHGHNDIVAVFFVLAALTSLLYKKPFWSLPLLMMSVLVKYSTIFLWPVLLVYLWRTAGRRLALAGAVLSVVVAVVLFAPWWAGLETFSGLSIMSQLQIVQRWPWWWSMVGGFSVNVWWWSKILFLVVYFWLLARRLPPTINNLLADFLIVILLPFVTFLGYSQPWYFILPMVLLIINPIVNHRWVFVFTAAALLYNFLPLALLTTILTLWWSGEILIKKYYATL